VVIRYRFNLIVSIDQVRIKVFVGFTGGGLLRVYSCSDIVANRFRKQKIVRIAVPK
jgi:hypothetical protein